MAKVEITVPGERIVEEFTALVPQPTTPSTARAPDVGLVELTYVNPTELVPGPPGPPGPRGSRWTTGDGAPVTPGLILGDMYLDDATGDIWSWDGTQWVNTGTNLSAHGPELLAEIKTVDGIGSGLDADLLDGQDSPYYLNYNNLSNKPASFPPTLPIPQSGVIDLVADQTTQNNAINLKAPIASPAFTGDPTAPTPATADNDTSIATTAYVKANINGVAQFPEAPNDGLTYGRKSLAWATIVGGAVVSDSAPGAPLQNGQLWFKSNEGNTYIWVDDGNTTQWVMQNVMPATGSSPVATAQTRNRIVNPAMQISQENGETAGTASGYYAADQWQAISVGIVFSTQRFTLSDGQQTIRITATTGKPSLAAGDTLNFRHNIEGSRIRDFLWGTASARPAVLRFECYAILAGTYSVSIRNGARDRCFLAAFTIPATTWTTFTVPVPGDTTGVWPQDNTSAMEISFTSAAGTTFLGSAGWQAGGFLGVTGMTNGASAASQYLYVRNVGLYLDPQNTGVAPAWQMPDEAEELRACRRYWADYYAPFLAGGYATAASQPAYNSFQFQVPTRANGPAITFSTPTNTNTSGMSVGTSSNDGLRISTASSATGTFLSLVQHVYVNSRM